MLVIEKRGDRIVARFPKYRDLCLAVYVLVQLIPLGRVTSYGEIARLLGTSPRLVAKCLSENKDLVVVPCHRVVYSTGDLGGYGGLGPEFKKKLLALEGVELDGRGRVSRNSFASLKWLLE